MHLPPQDDLYRPNHYISLMEFRELTLKRLQKFVGQRFFSVRDYLASACSGPGRQPTLPAPPPPASA
jgi:hypothetical protein